MKRELYYYYYYYFVIVIIVSLVPSSSSLSLSSSTSALSKDGERKKVITIEIVKFSEYANEILENIY